MFLRVDYLKDKKNNFKNLKLEEEIDFADNEIRSFVTLDRIKQINKKTFEVSVSFAVGPL